MLGKNAEIGLFDAHFHYSCCKDPVFPEHWAGCSCAHSAEEWKAQQAQAHLVQAFGLHPQAAGRSNSRERADFLESLAKQRLLSAIGEAGFDYFSEEFKEHKDAQEQQWNIQLELAVQHGLPLVVHCRKANEKLFEYARQLKKLPGVLFHSFMGMPSEAVALRRRGINAYFSFGKQVLNNNKKVIACVRELPAQWLLCETDAPYQTLRGEAATSPSEIGRVYRAFCDVREQDIRAQLNQNFCDLFLH